MGKQARLQEEYEFDETLLTQFGIRLEASGYEDWVQIPPLAGPLALPRLG